jgi:DNA-directed RNA polymerase specialized sigma24 family protein
MNKEKIEIPTSVFKDRRVAVLESLVEYLKDIKNLSYHEIAILLNRNDRTIWTVYNRVKRKRAREKNEE